MADSLATQLRFPAMAAFTVRGDFDGGAISSDFGVLLLHGVDRQTGLVASLAAAIQERWWYSAASSSAGGQRRDRGCR